MCVCVVCVCVLVRRQREVLTLRLLGDGHAEPLQVDAVLAAHAGRAAAKRVKGDGAHHQGQLQTELRRAGHFHTDLPEPEPQPPIRTPSNHRNHPKMEKVDYASRLC